MLDINGGEFIVLGLLVALVLGPDRLPELARSAGRLIRRGRDYATGASAQMKNEMGVDLDGVDWTRYDPRQYHPRRIVQNALSDAFEDEGPPRKGAGGAGAKPGAAASAAKRAEAARTAPAGTATTRPGGTLRPGGSNRTAGAGPGSASRDSTRSSGPTAPLRPSPAPSSWAEAARRAGVDDDAT